MGDENQSLSNLVYDQLKAIAHVRMKSERKGHSLHTTALVHEAMIKLRKDGQVRLEQRTEFFRCAAVAMRQILIDHARAASRRKRGGGEARRVEFDIAEINAHFEIDPDQILSVDEAIQKLEKKDAQSAELVRMRFFAGLSMQEAADAMKITLRAAERTWTYARAWLSRELGSKET